MDILSNIGLGLATALAPVNLTYCLLGVVLGTVVGMLPGLGALAAISMLLPITFHVEPTTALIMLAGIWYGTAYGGSIASILLNLPGSTSSAVACLDGYPMAQQGRAGVALLMTTVASFIGASMGIVLLMLFAPLIAQIGLGFGSTEYFALMLLGLVAATSVSDGSALKGLAMVTFGIAAGLVGMDVYTGADRYTFNVPEMADGVSLVGLAMGLFGVAEIIASVRQTTIAEIDRESWSLRKMIPTRDDWRRSWLPILRGSSIGSFIGTLPGTGPAIASFLAYAVEKRVAKDPSRFGKGAIEGVVSPEASNNAADQTAFIPTLSLGIPGSATMALILAALLLHGITPGPQLMTQEPELFWGLVMSFWVGNILLVILNAPMVGVWIRILLIPYRFLYPSILVFICIGVYTVSYNVFEVWLVIIFGVVGYLLRILNFPIAPVLLGFVLGPLMEEHFRRAMLISRGDLMTFVERPISGTVLLITALLLVSTAASALLRHRRQRLVPAPE
ncbi:tripartite tricarboxylate transporter permease [Mangrovicella endophytica]|uniref:tripartite tricarboxylate transporter permease n=1 Tax=Mangrovicella endophytica TaxID=2066697 RepID=UPI000C9E8377|nr:tripartite tricarboxylate transporter permease [Mangrovicella endophytica]